MCSNRSCAVKEHEEDSLSTSESSCSDDEDDDEDSSSFESTEYTSNSSEATDRTDFTERLPPEFSRFEVDTNSSNYYVANKPPSVEDNDRASTEEGEKRQSISKEVSSAAESESVSSDSSFASRTDSRSDLCDKSDDSKMIELSELLKGNTLDDEDKASQSTSDRILVYLERTRAEMANRAKCCCSGGATHSQTACPDQGECTINCLDCRGAGCFQRGIGSEFREGYTSNARRDRLMYECVNNLSGRDCIGRIGKYGKITYPKK